MVRLPRMILLSVLLLLGAAPAVAQLDVKTYELGKNAFGFHGASSGGRITTFLPDNEAARVFQQIIGAQGISARIVIRASGDVSNAAAFVDDSGARIIAYNVLFMDEIKRKSDRYWSLISIMAHEVGHHLNFHTYVAGNPTTDQSHRDELEADYFSGHALARLGASLEEALAAMRAVSPAADSPTHPGRDTRLQAIALGWKAATDGQGTQPPPRVEARPSPGPRPEPSCAVADPTGTPLNVRESPQGRVVGTLRNGTAVRVVHAQSDQKNQEWAYVASGDGTRQLGWVIRRHLNCSR